jgi:hypothetical protein
MTSDSHALDPHNVNLFAMKIASGSGFRPGVEVYSVLVAIMPPAHLRIIGSGSVFELGQLPALPPARATRARGTSNMT